MSAYLYRHFDAEGVLLYVGISIDVGRRTGDHAKHSAWFDRVARIDVETFDSRDAAIDAERRAIINECPLFNVHHNGKAAASSGNAADLSGEVFTIEEFCSAHRISRAHYFNICHRGEGPQVMKIGKRRLISREAAAVWRRQCERA
jgi:hypothetical protein